jgi:hypothetical protein
MKDNIATQRSVRYRLAALKRVFLLTDFIAVASPLAARLCAPVWEIAHHSSSQKLPETNGGPLVGSGGMSFASLLSDLARCEPTFGALSRDGIRIWGRPGFWFDDPDSLEMGGPEANPSRFGQIFNADGELLLFFGGREIARAA